MKTLLLQKILFPKDERLQVHWGLFYRASRMSLSKDFKQMFIPAGSPVDFATYLNGFSIQKWRLYSNLSNVTLRIILKGHFLLNAVGYHLNPIMPDRHEFSSEEYDFAEPTEIQLSYPDDTSEQFLSFEIVPFSECEFSGGAFYADFKENDIRKVNLSLATTTCHKEEFIKKNVQLLKEELLCEGSEMRENFFVHVVDNGRTLSKEEIESYHVTLHPNKNVGGSGGFARGMIESLHQSPEATHVLLMDDDVLVLPESIRRTYTLLTVLKKEWQEAFIAGAMLEFGAMNIQHEDLAYLSDKKLFFSAKGGRNQNDLKDVLETNIEVNSFQNAYAAWWFCCIPIGQIRKNGLPLPLFIRCDDAEYGVRVKPKIITMTGICVWHMGFACKFNVNMDFYQAYRNLLITASTTSATLEKKAVQMIKTIFAEQLREFAYNGAESICLALEDYMKGPDFIEQDLGEKLLKEHGKLLSEKFQPLSNLNYFVPMSEVYANPSLNLPKKIVYYITYNFQRFCPKHFLKNETEIIAFDNFHNNGSQFRHSNLLAVNPFERTGHLRTQNRKTFKLLMKRFKKDMSLYKRNRISLRRSYQDAFPYLTSETFWKKYLEIE